MAAQLDPERYTPHQWFEDFGAYVRSPQARKGGKHAGEWAVMHFATKYTPESEALFRQKRFEAALAWMQDNIDAIGQTIGRQALPGEGLVINAAVLRTMYILFAIDHGQWPVPVVPVESVCELIRKNIQAEKERPDLFG